MGKRHPSQAVLSVWKRDGGMVSLYLFSADATCKTVGQHFDLHIAVLMHNRYTLVCVKFNFLVNRNQPLLM